MMELRGMLAGLKHDLQFFWPIDKGLALRQAQSCVWGGLVESTGQFGK